MKIRRTVYEGLMLKRFDILFQNLKFGSFFLLFITIIAHETIHGKK